MNENSKDSQKENEPLKIPVKLSLAMIGCLYMAFFVAESAGVGAMFILGFIATSIWFVEEINAPNGPTWHLYFLTLFSLVGAIAAYDISENVLIGYLCFGYAIGRFFKVSASEAIDERFDGYIPDFVARLIIPCGMITGLLLVIGLALGVIAKFFEKISGQTPTCLPIYGCY